MRGEMKFMKKAQTWKASSVEFNPSSFEGTSYNWWHFVRLINGKVVFNDYNYSPTTCKHQQKMRKLLDNLNIKIDLYVSTAKSLTDSEALTTAIKNEEHEIAELELILTNPRRKKALDESRKEQIANKLRHIIDTRIVMVGNKLQAVMK